MILPILYAQRRMLETAPYSHQSFDDDDVIPAVTYSKSFSQLVNLSRVKPIVSIASDGPYQLRLLLLLGQSVQSFVLQFIFLSRIVLCPNSMCERNL